MDGTKGPVRSEVRQGILKSFYERGPFPNPFRSLNNYPSAAASRLVGNGGRSALA